MEKTIDKLSKEIKTFFPLKTIKSVEEFFKAEISKENPNLALVSIVLGAIEHYLTHVTLSSNASEKYSQKSPGFAGRTGKNKIKVRHGEQTSTIKEKNGGLDETGQKNIEDSSRLDIEFNPLEYETVETLYEQFQWMIVGSVNVSLYGDDDEDDENDGKETETQLVPPETMKENGKSINFKEPYKDNIKMLDSTPRNLVKKVSDVVWENLSSTYAGDKPHMQSLFNYLIAKKLDSFGVALAVVTGCQILGLEDVHLALSEDHAWVYFGKNKDLTAEVSWHGKGNEDRRGQSIGLNDADVSSWLYLKGFVVKCDRYMEIASIVASINPCINHSADSLEMGVIQQRLLWILYDAGHLNKYPLAITALADLEEVYPTEGRLSCDLLYEEAINSSKRCYRNMHVHPYTYYGAYLYRKEDFKAAIQCWADAADVIQNYRYSKHDEGVYKEFMEISKDYISHIMKQTSAGISATSLTRDPNSLAQLLRFFDGICMWEESSKTQVVHIIWAKAWIQALGKFDSSIRKRVRIFLPSEKHEGSKENLKKKETKRDIPHIDDGDRDSGIDEDSPNACITFRSSKMQGIKDLLQLDKFNSGTLTLHLTAQTLVAESANNCSEQEGVGGSRTRKVKSLGAERPLSKEDAPLNSSSMKRSRKH